MGAQTKRKDAANQRNAEHCGWSTYYAAAGGRWALKGEIIEVANCGALGCYM